MISTLKHIKFIKRLTTYYYPNQTKLSCLRLIIKNNVIEGKNEWNNKGEE